MHVIMHYMFIHTYVRTYMPIEKNWHAAIRMRMLVERPQAKHIVGTMGYIAPEAAPCSNDTNNNDTNTTVRSVFKI